MKKVLITGGAGYIGSELTGHFLRDGYEVTCLDSLMYDSTSLLRYTVDSKFNFEKGDVRDTSFLNKQTLLFLWPLWLAFHCVKEIPVAPEKLIMK